MRLLKPRTIILGGIAVAAVAGALKNRDKVAGLIGVRSSAPEPWTPASTGPEAPPPPSNVDLPREEAGSPAPPTSTAVEDAAPPVIDEAAEEAAAAAEAAAIGGGTPAYSGVEYDERASEEERAVIEAGGGEAEGQEQAEADLVSNVETNIGEPQPGYASITDAIQAEDSPGRWETVEPIASQSPELRPNDELESEARQSASHPLLSSEQAPAQPAPGDSGPEDAPTATPVGEGETPGTIDAPPEAAGSEAETADSTLGTGADPVAEPPADQTEEDSGISSAPSWGERFRARVRERDEARSREGSDAGPGAATDETAESQRGPETPADEKSAAVWASSQPKPADAVEEPPGSLLAPDEQPTVEADSVKDDDDDGSEWQTWSGRAVDS